MSGKLRAGSLNRTIDLVGPGAKQDDGFTTRVGDADPVRRRASVRPAMGNERLESSEIAGKRVLSIWLRSDAVTRTVDERWKVIFEGRSYELVAPPIEVGLREGVELLVSALDEEPVAEA